MGLHSGVLAHSSARALDRAGWRVDEGGPAADGGLQLCFSPGSVAAKLEQLQAALPQLVSSLRHEFQAELSLQLIQLLAARDCPQRTSVFQYVCHFFFIYLLTKKIG